MRWITIFANDSVRFQTAPTGLMEYALDNHFRERLGAVSNRTIGVNLAKPQARQVRFVTAPYASI